MLEKNPATELAPRNADARQVEEGHDYRSRFAGLVARVTAGFCELAKVPAENTGWFQFEVAGGFERWLTSEAINRRAGLGERNPVTNAFKDLEHTALQLYQGLLRLEPQVLEAEWLGEYSPPPDGDGVYFLEIHLRLRDALAALNPPLNITTLRAGLAELAKIANWQRRTVSGDVRGNKNGGRPMKYKDVASSLVPDWGRTAYLAGGRFTLDPTLAKGTLLDALDISRARLLQEQAWSWVAQFLPPPGQHPVGTYHRRMKEARRFASRIASALGIAE
jgi:hypothetical protein